MGSVNKVILVGNLGRDAELRYTPGGAPVATLNMATTEVWNDKGGQRQEKTEWHRVVLWGKTAESLNEYLVKGNLPPDKLPENLRDPLPPAKNVVVIGGGDTSMDCVRTAVRLGAEHVVCVYRRTESEMLGRTEEREHAKQEGVDFQFLTIPLRFIGDDQGRVTGLECQKMALG